jgi:steroid delta-isomerase-like uncharacterized protein
MADTIAIARQNVDFFNSGDWEKYRAIQTPDATYDELATQRHLDRDGGIEAAKAWKAAFPDAKGTITNSFAGGDQVTLEITWVGTHTGSMLTPTGAIPASGKRVDVKAVQVVRVKGDQIAAVKQYFDLFGLLQQIGAIPAPARV